MPNARHHLGRTIPRILLRHSLSDTHELSATHFEDMRSEVHCLPDIPGATAILGSETVVAQLRLDGLSCVYAASETIHHAGVIEEPPAQPSSPDAAVSTKEIAASDDKTSSDHFWSSPPLGIDTKAGVARLSWRRSINPTAVTLVFRSLSPIGADGLSLITSAWFHGHPAPAALPKKPIMTNYVRRIPRQQPSPRRAATRRSSVQHPGDAGFSLAGSSSVGAGCARGRGFDVEEYAQRIYRANINLVLAEVPRDYSKPAQAPDF